MKHCALGSIVCWLLSLLVLLPSAQAQTSWKGTVSSDWSAAGNWTVGVPSSSVNAIIGDANFTGPNQPTITGKSSCKSLTIGVGTKPSTLTVSHAFTVAGDIIIGTNGTVLHNTSQAISLGGDWNNAGTYTANQNHAAVTFSGISQTISGATTFNRININAGSTTTMAGNFSVTGQLSVSGILDPGEAPTYTISGNAKLFVRTGGTLRVKAFTFVSNYNVTGAKNLATPSTIDYAAETVNQTVANNLTYSTLRISGGTIKTLAGNLPGLNATSAAGGNIIVAAGTLDLGAFTADRSKGGGGTVSVANGAILRIGGTHTFPANYATHSLGVASTVIYSGTSQTVSAEAYGNLTLTSSAGSATKTMPTTAMTVAGNLTSAVGAGTAVSFTAGAAITVQGNVSLGASTTFNGSSFAHTVGGNWTNSGTFTGATGSVTFSGAGTMVSGSGANNFNDMTVTGAGVRAASTTSLGVSGNFTTSGPGSFTHVSGGGGTVTMSGASKAISGTGIAFNHLTISGSIATTSSMTIAGNLSVTGGLSATGGTITMTGAANTISGSGTITFYALNVHGGISTASNFSMRSDLSVLGTFTATAGTASFVGTSRLSGTANLFNVTLNGTKLQLGTGSVLGIAGAYVLTAGTFDTSTTTPNTVSYNAPGPQTILAVGYDNLTCAGSGAKTAGGALTVLGDLFISPGTSFSAGSFTHSISGNWINDGSFLAGTSIIQFLGASDTAINGASAFNVLTLNKAAANNLTLNSSINTVLLNMNGGRMLTGPNSVTITSTRTGNGIILGTITRTHAFAPAIAYAFESPNNTVTFSNLTGVSSVTVQVLTGPVADFPYGASVNRQYFVDLTSSGPYLATLRLHYESSELNGNYAPALQLLRFEPPWTVSGVTARDSVNNWVEQNSLSDVTGRWTISDNPKVVAWRGLVSSAWETAANWDAYAGSPSLPPGTNELVLLGVTNFLNQPTISSSSSVRSVFFGDAQGVNLTLGAGGSLATSGNISGGWSSNATHNISVGSQTLSVGGILQLSDGTNGHAINLSVDSGSASVSGDLVQSGEASIAVTTTGNLQIGGDFDYESGSFSPGNGTVTYNGAAAQLVAGGLNYNNLAFAKTGGTASLTNSTTVGGNLVVTNGGAFQVAAALTISNDVVIYTNATLDGSSATVSVSGDWTNNGTFTPGAGTVVFTGTNSQYIASTTFNNLTINKSANTALLAGNLVLNGDLTVAAGTLDLGTFSAARSAVGGTFTLAANTDLRIGSAFPSNFDLTTIDPTSTAEFYGSTAQVVPSETYGNLYFSDGGATAKGLGGDATIAGDLVINSGATLNANTFTLTLQGNWTNNGAFTASTGLVALSGPAEFLSGPTTFNGLNVSGNYTALSDIIVNGEADISGTYAAGANACTFEGNLFNDGNLSSGGTITFVGTNPQTLAPNSGFTSTGTVIFNGSVSPTFNSLAAPAFQNVTINNSGGIAPDIDWTIQGDFVVDSGAVFNGGSGTDTFDGNFTNLGTVTSLGTLVFNPASAVTLALGGASFSAPSVIFAGSGPITFGASDQQFTFVTVANTFPSGVTPGGNWTIGGSLFVGATSILNGGAGFTHTLAGDLSDDGIFSGGGSQVIMTGTLDPVNGASIAGIGATTFNHLTVSGLVGADANFNVSGNFTNNGSFDGTGAIVSFTGNTSSFLAGSTTPTPFDGLVIAKNASSVNLAVNLSSITALTVASGTFDIASFVVGQNAAGGVLGVNAGALLRIGGGSTLPVFNAYAFDPAGTVEYYGAVPQSIAAVNYGSLLSSSTGTRTLPSAATVGIAGTFTPGSNSYTITNSTINYNGAAAQTVAAFNYFNLSSSSSGGRVLPSNGTIGVGGTFTPGANTYTISGSKVNFNGSSQTIPAFTFYNLTISGSGTKSLGGAATVTGTLDLETGTLNDGGFQLTAQGDVINQATHTGTGEVLLSAGAATHNLSGAGSYGNLELADTNGAALSLTNLQVNGTLTLTSGLLTTSTNIAILNPGGQVVRGAGYVVGFLRKSVGTGASFTNTFEIGSPATYAPVSVLFTNVTGAGDLTAWLTPGDHPAITNSGIAATRSVNLYWTLTNHIAAFGSYGATFNFEPTDIDPAANPTNFIVGKLDGGTWTLPAVVARAATSIQATGMTNFSAFVVGEPPQATGPTITAQPQSQRVNQGSTATFRVSATGPGSLGYTWTLGGSPVAAGSSSTLVVTNVQDVNAGLYAVIVDNGSPFTVTSSNALLTINHPPVLNPVTDQSVNELTLLTVNLTATDPDGGPLTFSLVSGPSGVSVAPDGTLTWTPTEAQGPGVYTITAQVQDDGTPPLSGTNSFNVTVNEVNSPPVLAPIPPQTNFSFVTITVTNSATDPDIPANHLTFSLGPNPPAGATIDPATGVFTWTLPGPNGSYNLITVTVTDDGSPPLSDSQTLAVQVIPASAPGIAAISILNNGDTFLSVTGTPSQTFWIQAAPALASPSAWVSIGTNSTGPTGLSSFEDGPPTNRPGRFYRLQAP
jgi:hypothetical protein